MTTEMEADEASAVATLLAGTRESPTDDTESTKSSPRSHGTNKRWRITPQALTLLECVYAKEACPSTTTRDALAIQLGATPRQVQVWFQNKRQRRASKAKREHEAMAKSEPSVDSLEDVPPTCSTAQLFFDLPSGSAPAAEAPEASPPKPPATPSMEPGARHASSATTPSPKPSFAAPSFASPPAAAATPHVRRINSLADLASVAECVESLEHLTGGVARAESIKDSLASLSRTGSLAEFAALAQRGNLRGHHDLASLSKVVSLADLATCANALGKPPPQQMAM